MHITICFDINYNKILPRAVADHSAKRKVTKYCDLSSRYEVVPFAVEHTEQCAMKPARSLIRYREKPRRHPVIDALDRSSTDAFKQ